MCFSFENLVFVFSIYEHHPSFPLYFIDFYFTLHPIIAETCQKLNRQVHTGRPLDRQTEPHVDANSQTDTHRQNHLNKK